VTLDSTVGEGETESRVVEASTGEDFTGEELEAIRVGVTVVVGED
jgi:hypothetical protein